LADRSFLISSASRSRGVGQPGNDLLGRHNPGESLARNGITALAGDPILQDDGTAADRQFPEALDNLLYPIRRSLDDPAKAKAYLDVAEKVLSNIATGKLGLPFLGRSDTRALVASADVHDPF
jgi:hypothetical protein